MRRLMPGFGLLSERSQFHPQASAHRPVVRDHRDKRTVVLDHGVRELTRMSGGREGGNQTLLATP